VNRYSGFHLGLVAVAMLASLAPAAGAQAPVDHKIPPGYEPEHGPDEEGLWLEVEEYEKAIRRSALLVTDPDINNYVDAIVCRVAGDYCPDFRVYVIRNPGFNASMTPTGVMQIWTGLLLRTASSDEVAAVIGHEIAHYTRLHTLARLRSMKNSMTAGSVFDIGIQVLTGVGTPVGQMMAALSVLSFSREQESEADFLGAKLIADAAYDPHAAYRVWESLIAEEEAAAVKRREPGIFSQTHPDARARSAALREWITAVYGPPDREIVSNDEHIEFLDKHYLYLMEDQLDTNRFGRTQELLQRHMQMGVEPALVRFFYGEMFRQRGGAGDEQRAEDAYRHSLEGGGAPPEAYRNLGYLLLKRDDRDTARPLFEEYLELRPDASDRAMIEFYLEE
jgi:tetratricopeptide (TPR) repeat protein